MLFLPNKFLNSHHKIKIALVGDRLKVKFKNRGFLKAFPLAPPLKLWRHAVRGEVREGRQIMFVDDQDYTTRRFRS